MKILFYKISYALFFCLILPALLVFWSMHLQIHLPLPELYWATYLLFLASIALMLFAMLNLKIYGKGLPMNAFPPKYFVDKGAYKYFKHPIYVGACLAVFSFFLMIGSSSGFWIIAPIFSAATFALVYGFEIDHIKKVFGDQKHDVFFSMPENSKEKANISDRLKTFAVAYIPWFLLYQLAVVVGTSASPINTVLSWENTLYQPQWVVLYTFVYVYAVLPVFLLKEKGQLREFAKQAVYATLIGIFLIMFLPFVVVFDMPYGNGFFDKWVQLEKSLDAPWAALPSFHVVWIWIASMALAKSFPHKKVLFLVLGVLFTASCWFIKVHSIVDLIAGIVLFLLVLYRREFWRWLQNSCETVANSWKEWVFFGRFRIINHGIYIFLAASIGYLIMSAFFQDPILPFLICTVALLSGGLWGQFVEGSPRLLRPFGFFGTIIGGSVGLVILAYILNAELLSTFAAIAVGSPVVIIIGRFRCLVQGCCHGKKCKKERGIKYSHPKSRVNKISGLQNKTLHNTQLYSMLSNLAIFIILSRMVYESMPAGLIVGLYFIITGITRFVEEHYRGEAQTKYLGGLRIYQWLSMLFFIVGIIFTMLPNTTPLEIYSLQPQAFYFAIALGLICSFAMSMDFPKSNVRFSRLSD